MFSDSLLKKISTSNKKAPDKYSLPRDFYVVPMAIPPYVKKDCSAQCITLYVTYIIVSFMLPSIFSAGR